MGTATRLLVFVIAVLGSPVARAADEVDLLLVLSSDVSRSIDAPNFKLQRDGYAAAIVNPRVIQAIRSGSPGLQTPSPLRYLRHGEGLPLWATFVEQLESSAAVRRAPADAIAGAHTAFGWFGANAAIRSARVAAFENA
jgi:hypothetical protein